MKVYMGSRGTAPLIFNLNARWRRVVTSRPGRFTPSKSPGTYWLRPGWPQRLSGFFFEKRHISSVVEIFEQCESCFFFLFLTSRELLSIWMTVSFQGRPWCCYSTSMCFTLRKTASTRREVSRWHSRRVNFGAKYFYLLCYRPSA